MKIVCPCGAVKVGEVWLGEGWTGGDYHEDADDTKSHGMCPECMEKYREQLRVHAANSFGTFVNV